MSLMHFSKVPELLLEDLPVQDSLNAQHVILASLLVNCITACVVYFDSSLPESWREERVWLWDYWSTPLFWPNNVKLQQQPQLKLGHSFAVGIYGFGKG